MIGSEADERFRGYAPYSCVGHQPNYFADMCSLVR
jgi:hypothetical protein